MNISQANVCRIRLNAHDIRKAYGATVALESAGITLIAGEVHALLGENGAGKSTLVKILSGIEQRDAGSIEVDDAVYNPNTILDARAQGIATAFQELSILPNLTVAENLFLPRLPARRFAGVNQRLIVEKAASWLSEYDLQGINPRVRTASLSLAERQRLEILRALINGVKVLILDEPTAALPDTEWLFQRLRDATANGIAILYVSHRLREIREICDRATIFRNGKFISEVPLDAASDADIFELMAGRAAPEAVAIEGGATVHGKARLDVSNLSGRRLKDVSFSLKAGEILGVAALDGQGQNDLFHLLCGAAVPRNGRLRLDDRPYQPRSPSAALHTGTGVAYLPAERKTEGIFASMTTASNITITALTGLLKRPIVTLRREIAYSLRPGRAVDIQSRYLRFAIGDLSGGNQQKGLVARVLATKAQTLLLFDPTRGVDVGTKLILYNAIQEFAAAGGAVLLYSSELSELIMLVKRCLVLYQGSLTTELSGGDLHEYNLVRAMSGS